MKHYNYCKMNILTPIVRDTHTPTNRYHTDTIKFSANS